MIAKFRDTCRGCGDLIVTGDEITWTPDGGPRCADCGPAQPDERRGTATAREDETGTERTLRARIEQLETQHAAMVARLDGFAVWAARFAGEFNYPGPDGVAPPAAEPPAPGGR